MNHPAKPAMILIPGFMRSPLVIMLPILMVQDGQRLGLRAGRRHGYSARVFDNVHAAVPAVDQIQTAVLVGSNII